MAVSPAALVEGIVLDKQMGRPLARARVTLSPVQGAGLGPVQRVTTDLFGRFAFSRVSAGACVLSAERVGFAVANYGQSRWNGPGTPIVLEAESRFVAQLLLAKLGVLTGEVMDENRVGIPNYPVLAYRQDRPLRLAGRGTTDDRGVFRISGLEPGRYHVRTGPKQLEEGSQFVPTWFGQTAAVQESQPVEVRLDEETSDIRITPLPGKLLRLSGKAAWPVTSVSLYSDLGKNTAGVSTDGRFVFDQLSPGSFELIAESSGGRTPLASYRKFWLGSDMEGIILEPSPAPRILAVCDARNTNKSDYYRQTGVLMRRISPPGEIGSQRIVCGDPEVYLGPGAWQIAVVAPPQYSVDSLEVDGKQAGNEVTVLPGQAKNVNVILSSKPATLRGKVLAPDGQPAIGAVVLLYAQEANLRWRIAARDVTKADAKGEFKLEGLPAGSYRVLASFEYEKPEQADWNVVGGTSLRLGEAEDLSLNLQL